MFETVINTEDDLMLLFLRIVAAIIILPYGLKKIGWLKGSGSANAFGKMKEFGVPLAFAWLITIAQTVGALALLVGFLGRIAAAGNFFIMFVAMFVHMKDGWSMNWYGEKKGEGIEYFVMIMAILLVIIIRGSGSLSIDLFMC